MSLNIKIPQILRRCLKPIIKINSGSISKEICIEPRLMFGDWPGVERTAIPKDDPFHINFETALERCRAFPYDLSVFKLAEPEIRFLQFLTKADKYSVDIGANIGYYSALLSPVSRRVVSFEANSELIPYLTINMQRHPNVVIFPIAAGSSNGELEFNEPIAPNGDVIAHSGSGASSTRFLDKMGISFNAVTIPVITLDSFQLKDVGFIKIDVEGAEYEVLKGAIETINRCRPNVVLENEYRHNEDCMKVFDFMRENGYNGYFFDRYAKRLKQLSFFSIQRNQIDLLDSNGNISDMRSYVYNFLFTPQEQDELIAHVNSAALDQEGSI